MAPRLFLLALLPSMLTAGSLAADPAARPLQQASRDSYLMLTDGIVGGFVPAHVRQRIVIVGRKEKSELLLMTQPTRNDKPTFQRAPITADQFKSLLATIANKGLFDLPIESPAGSEDIYQLNTSIAARAGAIQWRNGGPGGCVHGQSKTQPTEKQRQAFRAAVEVVKSFAKLQDKTPSDAATINAAVRQIQLDAVKPKAPRRGR